VNDEMTVIYYTSDYEKPSFEKKIQRALLDATGGLPLISVSQKPISFGRNICVGEVGRSSLNAFRQFQIGVSAAETKYVCSAEADFLYPKERFEFIPSREDVFYCMNPVYMLKDGVYFKCKDICEASIIVGRRYVLDALEVLLHKKPMWDTRLNGGPRLDRIFLDRNVENVAVQTPIVTFKTKENMNAYDRHYRKQRTRKLPVWGTPMELSKVYL
jgi:hypothetical protein